MSWLRAYHIEVEQADDKHVLTGVSFWSWAVETKVRLVELACGWIDSVFNSRRLQAASQRDTNDHGPLVCFLLLLATASPLTTVSGTVWIKSHLRARFARCTLL